MGAMKVRRVELGSAPGAAPARTSAGTVAYAIGDIHGRCDLLEALLGAIEADAASRPAQRRLLVYLGDYVSRGLDSRRVVELVIGHRPAGFQVVTLQGNHEDLLLRYLAGEDWAGRHWFDYDGMDALASYGIEVGDRAARDGATVERLRQALGRALPAGHLAFFRGLAACHDEGGYRFVHGGVRPGVPLDQQTVDDLLWIREPFLSSDADLGAVVVHGHSIRPDAEVRHNRIGIDTGASRSGVLTCLVLDGAARTLLQTAPGG
jgi:serine/threonine protein phosphatase 1